MHESVHRYPQDTVHPPCKLGRVFASSKGCGGQVAAEAVFATVAIQHMKHTLHVAKGSRVVLHYTLSLADGQVADTTRKSEPETLTVGQSDWLPVIEDLLLGLEEGEKRLFEIGADKLAPIFEPQPVQIVPRDEFPSDMSLSPGAVVGFALPSGEEIAGTIMDVNERDVTVDFSHPLLGHDLIFEVEILKITPPPRSSTE